ncbi:MAG: hypothetical protein IKA78_04640, partial [Oscillospiraceae bacterium]|nr:hypothetical protein [Oscillospiraceae bacterium]
MYTKEQLESIKKVEATREERLKQVLAGNHPRRMTAEEKDQVLLENHPDHIKSQFAELKIGPNKGEKVPLELAETLQANPRIDPKDIDLTEFDYDVDAFSQAVFDTLRKEYSKNSLTEIRQELQSLYT